MKTDNRKELTGYKEGYNERLFESRGVRSYFHNSRFRWFSKACRTLNIERASVFELGCFDGRLLQYLPFEPSSYLGFDADWEGGLSEAQKVQNESGRRFVKSERPEDFKSIASDSFDLCVAMETLEHLPPESVDKYLQELARISRQYLIASVPNEKGLVFLAKYAAKRFIFRDAQDYSFREVWHATTGQMEKVKRDDHKGFDYSRLVRQIEKHFEVLSVRAVPFPGLPRWAGFTIGIIARKRR